MYQPASDSEFLNDAVKIANNAVHGRQKDNEEP